MPAHRNDANLIHPIDAYAAARNGPDGFVGWAYYKDRSLGFHADHAENHVTVWVAGGPTDHDIHVDRAGTQFLNALDDALDAGHLD